MIDSINGWFYKKERTRSLMDKLSGLNDFFLDFESLTQANFIARLKQEQSAIRRILTRIHTIVKPLLFRQDMQLQKQLPFF